MNAFFLLFIRVYFSSLEQIWLSLYWLHYKVLWLENEKFIPNVFFLWSINNSGLIIGNLLVKFYENMSEILKIENLGWIKSSAEHLKKKKYIKVPHIFYARLIILDCCLFMIHCEHCAWYVLDKKEIRLPHTKHS